MERKHGQRTLKPRLVGHPGESRFVLSEQEETCELCTTRAVLVTVKSDYLEKFWPN